MTEQEARAESFTLGYSPRTWFIARGVLKLGPLSLYIWRCGCGFTLYGGRGHELQWWPKPWIGIIGAGSAPPRGRTERMTDYEREQLLGLVALWRTYRQSDLNHALSQGAYPTSYEELQAAQQRALSQYVDPFERCAAELERWLSVAASGKD